MFSTTPPPILPPYQLPPPPIDLSGMNTEDPNLPQVEARIEANWNDTKVEETALELMREVLDESRSSTSPTAQPSSPSTSSHHHQHHQIAPTVDSSSPEQTSESSSSSTSSTTPPRRFSRLSSVDTRDPTSRRSEDQARDRLEHDLDGHGTARRAMRAPEGHGDEKKEEEEEDRDWNGGFETKERLGWRGGGSGGGGRS